MRNCAVCRKPIPAKRLAAVPSATRCVACQGSYDLSPLEAFGRNRLDRGLAVMGELDSEMVRAAMKGGE